MEHRAILRSLDVAGFKSFARPARLEFGPGVTALVGPNGSGKSNLVDAIRWCLGEQNARDLRGQRAEDVIYAGPRRIQGVAEVELTFDLEKDSEASGRPELSVGRRVYRSGESEYLVDRQKVRLRDVVAALQEVDIDASRYIVVTQGMTDFLLSATSAERRTLLEQAAGLGGYRRQKDEARQKLAATNQNILSVESVLAELEPRVRMLRRQARAIEDRANAAKRLRHALECWYGARWHALGSLIEQTRLQRDELQAERLVATDELGRLERQADEALTEIRGWQTRVEELTTRVHEAERAADTVRHRRDQTGARLSHVEEATSSARSRVSALKMSDAAASERIENVDRNIRILEAEEHERVQAIAGLTHSISEMEIDARTHLEAMQEKSRVRAELELLRTVAERRATESLQELARHSQQRATTETWLHKHQASLNEADTELEQLAAKDENLRKAEVEREAGLDSAELDAAQAQARAERAARAFQRMRGSIVNLRRRQQALQVSIKAQDLELGDALIRSLVVRPGWELAAAAALDNSTVCIDDPETDARLTLLPSFLKWRASLEGTYDQPTLWGDQVVSGAAAAEIYGLLGTIFVNGSEEAAALWRSLRNVQAHRIGSPPVQIVSQGGELWTALGIRRSQRDGRLARFLRTKSEFDAVSARLRWRSGWLEGLERNRSEADDRLSTAEHRRRTAADLVAGVTRDRLETQAAIERMRRLRHDIELEKSRHLKSLEEMSAAVTQLEQQVRVEEQQLEHIRRDCTDATAGWEEASETERNARQHLAALLAQREDMRRKVDLVRAKLEIQIDARRGAEQERARADEELGRLHSEAQRHEDARDDLSAERKTLSAELDRLTAEVERCTQELRVARSERPTGHEEPSRLRSARERVADLVSRHERILARLEEMEREKARVHADVEEELGIGADTLAGPSEDVPSTDELRRMRTRVAQYEDLDPSVVREYAELDERRAYLRHHVEDLRTAAGTLAEVMLVADHEMQIRFQQAFDAVNQEFSRMFDVMLGGGEAALQLIEEGCVEVSARLPGRRARPSTAFSGGERSLIASSLLFGVLTIRPTPFCVLDEVDAALDETNVDRYLAALNDVSERTQVIVVTHNRATMAAARVLYGLTMGEDGASSLLSLRLDTLDTAV